MLVFNNLQGVSSKKQVKLFVTRHSGTYMLQPTGLLPFWAKTEEPRNCLSRPACHDHAPDQSGQAFGLAWSGAGMPKMSRLFNISAFGSEP
jgi:hypothetical protein